MLGFDSMFSILEAAFPIFFLLVIGIITFAIISGIRQWNKNNHSPVLTVDARVVNMREAVSHHHHMSNDQLINHSASTTYYATFQVESGDRIELKVSGKEYGMLAYNDAGKLTFQGTRYLGFVRHDSI